MTITLMLVIVGLLIALILTRRSHKKNVAALELAHTKALDAVAYKSFGDGFDQGKEYGIRAESLRRITEKKNQR